MQKISQPRKPKALIAAALVLGLITSCASTETSDIAPELPVSEAAFLDEAERATPVIDDSAIFSDLNAQPANSEMAVKGSTDFSSVDASSPFYNPIGGESLGRVAYTLYGDRKMFRELVAQNPDLGGIESLRADQRVFFDFNRVRPMPTYLTKDLLDRYTGELASKIESAGLAKETVTLAPGETLQSLSQRLYGTTRYWTEIFLLNHDTISNYDQVKAGLSLTVYQRADVAAPLQAPEPLAQENAVAPILEEAPSQQAAQPVLPVMDTPMAEDQGTTTQPTEMAPVAVDPIPETPTFSDSNAEPSSVAQPEFEPKALPESTSIFSNSANLRRVIYVVLILLIGGLAFYLTRSSKKKGFDMLDVTTSDTTGTRPKLSPKDTQKQDIG